MDGWPVVVYGVRVRVCDGLARRRPALHPLVCGGGILTPLCVRSLNQLDYFGKQQHEISESCLIARDVILGSELTFIMFKFYDTE